MRYYVEAYRGDGTQVLGNLDGQTSWKGSHYKKTSWYKYLTNPNRLISYKQIHHWVVIDEQERIHERIFNKRYTIPNE
jgi:hypothetical protein